MKVKISINKSKVPWDELMETARQCAPDVNKMDIEWKMWLVDKEKGLIGGVYYFEDEEAYKKSIEPLSKTVNSKMIMSSIDNVYSITIDVDEELSKYNKAPV
jgi:hypothetical protein